MWRYDNTDANLALEFGAETYTTRHGLQVLAVEPGSPAAKLGLRRGDLLCQVNDLRMSDAKLLRTALYRSPRAIRLLAFRNGNYLIELRAKVSYAEAERESRSYGSGSSWGSAGSGRGGRL